MPSLKYFSQYPEVIYTRPTYSQTPIVTANGTPINYEVNLTNILIKYAFSAEVASNASLFYPYQWQDSDRPDLLGLQYYGSSSYFWIVMYSNNAMDVDYDFPMQSKIFNAFLEQKYRNPVMVANGFDPTNPTSLESFLALPDTQRYVMTVAYLQSQIQTYTLYFTDEPTNIFNIDLTQYNYYSGSGYTAEVNAAAALGVTLPPAVVGAISLFEYEDTLNESKRAISLLDNDFTSQVVAEFNTTMGNLVSNAAQIGDI